MRVTITHLLKITEKRELPDCCPNCNETFVGAGEGTDNTLTCLELTETHHAAAISPDGAVDWCITEPLGEQAETFDDLSWSCSECGWVLAKGIEVCATSASQVVHAFYRMQRAELAEAAGAGPGAAGAGPGAAGAGPGAAGAGQGA